MYARRSEKENMKLFATSIVVLVIAAYLSGEKNVIKDVVLAPLMVAEGVSANVEMRNLQYMIVSYYRASGILPAEHQFEEFVLEHFESEVKNPCIDIWGNRYQYRLSHEGFELYSAGPDKQSQTQDDLVLIWRDSYG